MLWIIFNFTDISIIGFKLLQGFAQESISLQRKAMADY